MLLFGNTGRGFRISLVLSCRGRLKVDEHLILHYGVSAGGCCWISRLAGWLSRLR